TRALATRLAACFVLLLTGTFAHANQPPLCGSATGSLLDLWPPNHKIVPISVTGVIDPDHDPVAIRVTSVTQDEPVEGGGDGNTCPDAIGVGTATVGLRAERSGAGDGRAYHVEFAALDPSGSSCHGAFVVCVPHDRGHGGACVDGGSLFDSTQCS